MIFRLLLPELLLGFTVLLLFLASAAEDHLRLPPARHWLPVACLAVAAGAVAALGARGVLLYATYTVDGLSQFFKLLVASGFLALVCNAALRPPVERERETDYFLFMGFSALGLMLLCSCTELMTLYIALELASYSLYVLIPMRGNTRESAEAGAKYILFGAAATAVSLFGLSLIMASCGSTFLAGFRAGACSFSGATMPVLGLCLFMCGMFYKLALFPFHFWCPDVYQGAANETAAYSATLPKLGAVVVLIRLLAATRPDFVVTDILAVLGLASMTFGNLCALVQKDVKRLLGYSSVAHAGYVMVGLVAGTAHGLAAAAFYAPAYLSMNLACFWVVCRVARDGRNLKLDDLKGLARKSPALALALTAGAFSLLGLPPLAGFTGKLFLVLGVWGAADGRYNWLAVGLVLNTAIAVYYYLNMVRLAYAEPADSSAAEPDRSLPARLGAGLLALAVVLLGVFPSPVFSLLMDAAESILR